MNRISLNALWPKRRMDVLHVTPLILIVIILSAAVDLVFWYFAFNAAGKYRSAFIGVASAWGLAVVAYVANWLQAVTDEMKRSRESRHAAYAKFLSASDDLVAANARLTDNRTAYDSAQDKLDATKRQYESSRTNQDRQAEITADVNLDLLSNSLRDASNDVEDLRNSCEAASKDVDQLAPHSVRPAFETFKQCPAQDTPDRADARSRFVKAARDDLKLRQRDGESTL